MEYSGRTTALEHKRNDWKDRPIETPRSSITQETIFDVQWSDCPVEVEEEVKQLWSDYEAGNDHWYLPWDDEEDSEDYPIISEYLKSKGVIKCLIHWWW